jgi:hypothetical protein
MLPLAGIVPSLNAPFTADDRIDEPALPVLVFANQHIDVSIRFLKHLRVVQGLCSTDRCRPPAPLDRFQQQNPERLARHALALEARSA